jgi:phage shock protein C
MNCSACGNGMNEDARFCSNCGRVVMGAPVVPVRSRLSRPRDGGAIAGVCAGFAQEYGWDVVLVRLALCATVILGCGAPILLYVAAWIVMPNEAFVLPVGPVGPEAGQAAV